MFCSRNFTLSVSAEDKVYSFGSSQFGLGQFTGIQFSPKIIPELNNIKSVGVGKYHFICSDNDGIVYTFGINSQGQLGENSQISFFKTPHRIWNSNFFKQVSCGDEFTMCLSQNGDIYSFGYNFDGQLGRGNIHTFGYNRKRPENRKTYKSKDTLPSKIPTLKNVEYIQCGRNHTFCKIQDGEIYSWGDNEYGQLGIGNSINQLTPVRNSLSREDTIDIKCGSKHTLILTSNGEVHSCGFIDQIGRTKSSGKSQFYFYRREY